jgi:hypothetical protein
MIGGDIGMPTPVFTNMSGLTGIANRNPYFDGQWVKPAHCPLS